MVDQLPEGTQYVQSATIATLNEAGEVVQMEGGDGQATVNEIIFINVYDQNLEDEVILIEETDHLPPPPKKQKTVRAKKSKGRSNELVDGDEQKQPCSYAVETMFLRCTEEGCPQLFKDKKERNNHLQEFHQLLPFFCPLTRCNRRFESRFVFICNFHCLSNLVTFLSGKLTSHIKEFHRHILAWPCPKCPNQFKKYKLLYMHMWIMHDDGRFKCPHEGCDFEATYRKQVYNHIDHRHQALKCVCPFDGCNKAFTTKNELKAHERRVHLMLKPYRCKWPGWSYSSEVCPAVIR